MSIWSDINKRSQGQKKRKEDLLPESWRKILKDLGGYEMDIDPTTGEIHLKKLGGVQQIIIDYDSKIKP